MLQNDILNPLDAEPVINDVTASTQHVKDGDLIELLVTCDQANYSLSANFSTIDDTYAPSDEKILDYNDGTYRINYTLNLFNSRPDGMYQVIINATNITSGNFTFYTDLNLTLDNIPPSSAAITSPKEGAYLKGTFNIQATAADAGSGVSSVEFWDGQPGPSGDLLEIKYGPPYNYTWNTNSTPEGPHALFVRVHDLAGNANTSLAINITIDNTIPTLTDIVVYQTDGYFFIFGNASGTISPISNFTYNISEFILSSDPTGELSGLFVFNNSGQPLPDGNYILTITITDSVNRTYSLVIPLTVDTTPPTFDKINHTPSEPEYDEDVQVTIYNASDAITGIKNITLYYSIDGGIFWTPINITANRSGIIPQFQYDTEVLYYIELFDNYPPNVKTYENFSYVKYINNDPPNIKISENFSYKVNDTRPPIIWAILRNPKTPTQNTIVTINVDVTDSGAGLANIFLNYSVDGGIHWNLKDITNNKWGLIESQPPGSKVCYQIIAIDKAGNKFSSELMSYTVQFDSTGLIIFLIIIWAVLGISTYLGKIIYSRKKQKSLQMK